MRHGTRTMTDEICWNWLLVSYGLLVTPRHLFSVTIFIIMTELNECDSSPCANNGVCTDEINSFTCSCSIGWTDPVCSTGSVINFRWSPFQIVCVFSLFRYSDVYLAFDRLYRPWKSINRIDRWFCCCWHRWHFISQILMNAEVFPVEMEDCVTTYTTATLAYVLPATQEPRVL